MNAERYKQRSKRIAITGIIWLLICVVVIIGIAVFFKISPLRFEKQVSSRLTDSVAKNVDGNKEQLLFKGGVEYFN